MLKYDMQLSPHTYQHKLGHFEDIVFTVVFSNKYHKAVNS